MWYSATRGGTITTNVLFAENLVEGPVQSQLTQNKNSKSTFIIPQLPHKKLLFLYFMFLYNFIDFFLKKPTTQHVFWEWGKYKSGPLPWNLWVPQCLPNIFPDICQVFLESGQGEALNIKASDWPLETWLADFLKVTSAAVAITAQDRHKSIDGSPTPSTSSPCSEKFHLLFSDCNKTCIHERSHSSGCFVAKTFFCFWDYFYRFLVSLP